jgi:hypothetical protein
VRRVIIRVLWLGVGLAQLRCAPPPVDIPSTNRIALHSRTIFDESARGSLFRIFAIETADDHELLLITSDGVVWTTLSGEVVHRIDFTPGSGAFFPVRRLHDAGAVYYAGFHPKENRVAFFDAEGREFASHPCTQCRELVVADLDGTGRDSLVVRANDGKTATIFGDRGSTVRTLDATGYLTDIVAARLPGERSATLFFYSSPDPDLQKAVRLRCPDGHERGKWAITAGSAIVASTAIGGAPSILSIDANAVIDRDALTGRILSQTPIEGSSAFRELFAASWRDGSRVFLFAGGGALNKHMVVVVDAKGAVVFQQVGDHRAFALRVPSPDASMFYVAVEGRVIRYAAG